MIHMNTRLMFVRTLRKSVMKHKYMKTGSVLAALFLAVVSARAEVAVKATPLTGPYQKSYSLVKAPVTLSITIDLGHGHRWDLKEVDALVAGYLTGAPALPKVGAMKIADGAVSTTVSLPPNATVAKAELDYTSDAGAWHARKWQTLPANVKGDTVTAPLPNQRPLTCYLRVTDGRGLAVSTPHIVLAPQPGR